MKTLLRIAIVAGVLIFSCKRNTTNVNDIPFITLDQIYQQKITNFVDSLINLKTKVYWFNSRSAIRPSDSLFADRLRLKFENGDNYIEEERFKGQRRGDLFVVSDFITKRWDGLVEKYYFKDDSLSNNIKLYILRGRIRFRDYLNISESLLKDSAFINQCNNVVYWSQTFKFQVEDILSETD